MYYIVNSVKQPLEVYSLSKYKLLVNKKLYIWMMVAGKNLEAMYTHRMPVYCNTDVDILCLQFLYVISRKKVAVWDCNNRLCKKLL